MLVLIAWSITTLKHGSRSSDIMTLFKIPVDCQQMYTTWSLLTKHSNHFHNPPTAHQQFMQTQGLTVQVGVYSNKLVFFCVFFSSFFSFFSFSLWSAISQCISNVESITLFMVFVTHIHDEQQQKRWCLAMGT